MQNFSELLTYRPNHTATISTTSVRQRWLLAGILVFAVVLRIISALYQGDVVIPLPGTFDQVSYDTLARRLIDGHGFRFATEWWPITPGGEPTAHWSYLYTLYLSGIYSLFGAHPLIARLIQAVVVGLLQPWLAWRVGRSAFGDRAGLIAAGLTAGYAYFFYYAGALMTEAFYVVGVLWTLDVMLRVATSSQSTRSRRLAWLELGAALGITVLLRQLFMIIIPLFFLWHLWLVLRRQGRAGLPSLLGGWVAVGLIVVLFVLPWTVRNYQAFGAFTLLNTNAGYAFFWGNHPIYGTHFVGILPSDGPSYQDLIPQELRHLNEAELDQALLKRGLGFIAADPVRYVLLSASRTVEYFKFWPSADSSTTSNIARVASFGILLPFMLWGLWLSIWRWRRSDNDQQAALLLLYLFMTAYTGIHLLSWALIRYRLPVDAILVIFAAYALIHLNTRIRNLLGRRQQAIKPMSSDHQDRFVRHERLALCRNLLKLPQRS